MPHSAVSAPVDRVLEKLDGVKGGGGGKWTALCPSHDDSTQSLSITSGGDGRVLMKCHAGCAATAIVAAIGLSMNDLFPVDSNGARLPRTERVERNRPRGAFRSRSEDHPQLGPPSVVYDYTDIDGRLLFQTCRFQLSPDKKTFRQRHRDGEGFWVWELPERAATLYRLPEIAEAVAMRRRIFIVEGEKDADRLVSLGYSATTSPMGAGKWRQEYAAVLDDTEVVILPDNDDAGRKHVADVGASIIAHGGTVKIVALPNLPPKGDVSDWLANGGSVQQLDRIVEQTRAWAVGDPVPFALAPPRFKVLTVKDLKALPPLEWLIGEEKAGLFPANSMHATFGAPGAGKSFIVTDLACSIASRRDDLVPTWFGNSITHGPVLYIVAEGGRGFPRRIAAWQTLHGIGDDELDLFCIAEPVNLHGTEDITHILRAADLLREPPALVVFDTLARSMVGGDENSAQDVGLVVDRGGRVVREIGSAVHFVHHSRKDSDTERGSSSLRGGVDTLCLVSEDEESGRVLSCVKQKDADPFDPMTFYLMPVGDSCVVSAQAPAGIRTLTAHQRAALKVLADFFDKGATATEWLKSSGVAERTFYRVRAGLIKEGFVGELTRGGSSKYSITTSGHHALNGIGRLL